MPSRRQMLKSSLALAAGAVGLGAARRLTQGPSQPAPTPVGTAELPATISMTGRNWHAVTQGKQLGQGPAPGDRTSVFGELVDERGERLGEFFSSCSCMDAPFGGLAAETRSLETHTFRLTDGTIHGIGTTTPGEDESVFAVVGGTGLYLGARGSYTARQQPVETGGDGSAAFTLTLTK